MSNPSINNNTIPPVSDALVKNQGGLLPFSVFFIVLFILAVGAGVGAYFFLAGSTLVKAVEEGLNNNEKAFAKDSMKIVRLSVKWTDKTADTASGEFTVNAKTTENLYKYIDNDAALKKLGITELYSAEYNTARQKFSDLPDKYQKNVTGGTSEDTDISLLRFYEIFVPEGDSIIRTGIAELKKESGSWLVSDFKVYPYQFGEEKFKDDFLPESKIPQGKRYKLDDPETKITVNNIIQKRKDFAAQVDDEYKQYEIDKRDEEVKRLNEIKKEREREAAEEEADYQRQLAEYQREVLQVPIDNFNAFCGEGKKYEGTYGFNGGFKMNISIEFNNNNAKVNTIDGTLTFYCPSDRGEQIPYQYPFSLTCENGQVKGTITNKCPTVSKFRKDIGFIGLVGDDNKRGAMKFYDEILSDSTDIEIQFTHTVKLTITGKNGNRIEPNFNRLMFVPKQPGPPPVRKGALQNFGVGELVEAVNLNKEINLNVAIRASGFEADHYALHDHYALRDFVRYGSNDLKAKLYAASLERSNVKQFDDDAIRKANDTVAKVKADIEEKQKEIASKTFYCDCSYRVNNPRNHGDGTSGFDMYLNDSHGIPIPKGTKILFLPNVIGVTGTFDTYCFNVSGSTDGIGELVDGKAKYNVRVWCKDLRYDTTGTGRILDGINADVQKVEIVYAGTKP